MLVTFRCEVYPNTTYFGDIALTLLKMMGHSGTVPGAILADDIPKYLSRLQSALDKQKAAESKKSAEKPSEQDRWQEQPVALSQRALPLIELLTAAGKAQCTVMWDRN